MLAARTRRFDSILVFILTIGVSLATLQHRSGYPLADAVEYLKNAARAEGGLPMMQDSVRPFFFSGFLSVIFRITRIFGSHDGREVVVIATAIMMLMSGVVAVVTYRFIEKIAGAPAALGAALFLAANRVFQFWAPTVATDVPCAMCIGAAAMLVMRPPSAKSALFAGAALGIGILFKYQAMVPAGLILLCLPFLWGPLEGRRRTTWLITIALLGILAGLTIQSVLDWLVGRGFGATLWNYVKLNVVGSFGPRIAGLLRPFVPVETLNEVLAGLMDIKVDLNARANAANLHPDVLVRQPYTYYWTQLPQFLTWIETALAGLGAVALMVRRPRGWWFPFIVLGGFVFILTMKASKEWRLFVSITPFVFLFVGIGFAAVIATISRFAPRLAAIAAVLFLAPNLISLIGGVPLQVRASRSDFTRPLLAYDARSQGWVNGKPVLKGWRPWQVIPECNNPADYGGYHRAADWVNLNAAAGSRVSATWFWQFHFRLRPDLFLVEPLQQFDDRYKDFTNEQKEAVRQHIRSLDYFVSHLQALVLSPELFEFIEREFELVATFENSITDDSLNTIFVLKKRAKPSAEGWWLRVHTPAEVAALKASIPASDPVVYYEGPANDRRPVVELLHCDIDPEALADGRVVARFTFEVPPGTPSDGADIYLHIRVRNSRYHVIHEQGYKLGYDRVTGARWKSGTVFTQRVPMRTPRELYDFAKPEGPGGIPSLSVWLQLARTATPRTVYPSPAPARFERLRDPETNSLRVGGIERNVGAR